MSANFFFKETSSCIRENSLEVIVIIYKPSQTAHQEKRHRVDVDTQAFKLRGSIFIVLTERCTWRAVTYLFPDFRTTSAINY